MTDAHKPLDEIDQALAEEREEQDELERKLDRAGHEHAPRDPELDHARNGGVI